MTYRFDHPDWFSNHAPLWDAVLEANKPKRVIEIGSFEGRSASYIIENCSKRNEIELVCIDPWHSDEELADIDFEQVEKNFDHNINLAKENRPNKVMVAKMKGRSIDCLSYLITKNYGKADLIYIDGSHLAADVLADAVLSFELLRVGGVLVFDDYNSPNPDTVQFPKLGIDSFMAAYANKVKKIPFMLTIDGKDQTLEDYMKSSNSQLYQLYLTKVSE